MTVAAVVLAWAGAARAACYDPSLFGAAANDGIDDAPAIRAAMLLGDVCVPSGVWDLEYVYSAGSVNVPAGRTLSGAGPSTVLRQHGDAHLGTWFGLTVAGGTVRDLSIMQDIINPDPAAQNHMVRVNASSGTRLSHLTMGPGSTGGGDCIQLLGNGGDITGLVISDVVAIGCPRSGIAVQHGVASGAISNVVLNAVTGGEIDYEPTSAGPTTIAWSGGVLLHTSPARALTMSDVGGQNGSTFTGLTIVGGNVQAVRAASVTFSGNVVIGSATAANSTFEVVRDSTGLRVVGNRFVRPAGAPAGAVVRVVCNQGLCPTRTVIADNAIDQSGANFAIEVDGLQVGTISGNTITTAWSWAIKLGASVRGSDVVVIDGNALESTAAATSGAAVYLAASAVNPLSRIVVTGNAARGFAFGVACANLVTGTVRVDANAAGAISGCTTASIGANL